MLSQSLEDSIIELNVGGSCYSTTLSTLLTEKNSYFASLFSDKEPNSPDPIVKSQAISNDYQSQQKSSSFLNAKNLKQSDPKNKIFIDRDGLLFRYVLDFLRNKCVLLPENFNEKRRLKCEAEFYRLPNMIKCIEDIENELGFSNSIYSTNAFLIRNAQHLQLYQMGELEKQLKLHNNNSSPQIVSKMKSSAGNIIIGYRGTFAFGREALSDVKFRKISRILVCGRVNLCREVFGESLNESRDPDHGNGDRYTSRFYLKHTFLEQAFDSLTGAGFYLVGTAATGTNTIVDTNSKIPNDNEENRWLHYTEFVFFRA